MKWEDTGGGDFEDPPIGTVVAICVRVIDIGTQRGEYMGDVNIRHQCIIAWELPNELMQTGKLAGQPFVVSRFYTSSLSKKANLRKHLAAWRTRDFTEEELKGFESKNILGKPCMLSLIMNDKGKVRVDSVMALPKGTVVPAHVTPLVHFDLGDFDPKVFDSLSDGIKKLIRVSPEYQHAIAPKPAPQPGEKGGRGTFDDMDDDIPF